MSPESTLFPVENYDLSSTLASGQAFRWRRVNDGWEGVVRDRWVRLTNAGAGISATIMAATDSGQSSWENLKHYLQLNADLDQIVATFPDDEPIRKAVQAAPGLRLLRQDPWECLASFILSSTKQIVQIQQIVAALCLRFGTPVAVPPGHAPHFAFPSAAQLAVCSETDLRECKMGFRAPYLLETARLVAGANPSLDSLYSLPVDAARLELMKFPGVGRKIADCVLLFAYGFQEAFPVDVWVIKALRDLYFRGRKVPLPRLQKFSRTHFGPNAGYAQQYLFHYMRTKKQKGDTP